MSNVSFTYMTLIIWYLEQVQIDGDKKKSIELNWTLYVNSKICQKKHFVRSFIGNYVAKSIFVFEFKFCC